MDRIFFAIGSISAGIAVALGAMAAHGLKARLSAEALGWWETAAKYQMYHALALLAVAWAGVRFGGALPRGAGWFFIIGTLLFSGSLYALALTGQSALGMITPFGGLSFIIGWTLLAIAALKSR